MNKENVEPQENSLGTDTSKNEQSNKNKTSFECYLKQKNPSVLIRRDFLTLLDIQSSNALSGVTIIRFFCATAIRSSVRVR